MKIEFYEIKTGKIQDDPQNYLIDYLGRVYEDDGVFVAQEPAPHIGWRIVETE